MAKKSKKSAAKKTAKKRASKASSKKAAGKKASAKKKAASRKSTSSRKKATSAKKASAKKKTSSGTARSRKPKSPLTKKQLREFRELLLEKRRSLIGDMTGMEAGSLGRNQQESSGDLSNLPTHPADIGSDNYEQEFTLGLLESERIMLNEINEALGRIEDGTYGICLGTGEPIGLPRLKARPWCKYSIDYQRKIEMGLVRPGQDDLYGNDEDLEDDEDDSEDEESDEYPQDDEDDYLDDED